MEVTPLTRPFLPLWVRRGLACETRSGLEARVLNFTCPKEMFLNRGALHKAISAICYYILHYGYY